MKISVHLFERTLDEVLDVVLELVRGDKVVHQVKNQHLDTFTYLQHTYINL